jgi:hypothetical protein
VPRTSASDGMTLGRVEIAGPARDVADADDGDVDSLNG